MKPPSDEKPTVKMPATHEPPTTQIRPIVREDPTEQDLPQEQRPTYRLVKSIVEANARAEEDRRAADLVKAGAQGAMETRLNNRVNALILSIERMGRDVRHEFEKKFRHLSERVDQVSATADDAMHEAGMASKALTDIHDRIETLETIQARVQKRSDYMAAIAPGSVAPWDLGKASDTGSHKLIAIADLEASRLNWEKRFDESLAARDKTVRADRYTRLVKWVVGVLGVTFTIVLTVVLQQMAKSAAQPLSPLPPSGLIQPH
jgi:hypothetical protein